MMSGLANLRQVARLPQRHELPTLTFKTTILKGANS